MVSSCAVAMHLTDIITLSCIDLLRLQVLIDNIVKRETVETGIFGA